MTEKTRRSLVIYLPNLASGGAERLHLHLAPAFAAAGYKVTFLLHRAEGSLLPLVPPGIEIISMNCGRTLAGLWPLVRFLKQAQPDILLSNLGHSNLVAIWAMMLARGHTRVVASFHNTLSQEAASDKKNRILPFLCRLFLRYAAGIVAVSHGVAEDLAAISGTPLSRISVIYNPVIFPDFDQRMAEPPAHPWLREKTMPVILGIGRLVEQKDFAMLIRAFAQVGQAMDARLIILGEGPLHDDLLALAQTLGIAERVSLPCFVPNPLPYIKAASVVAMSSRFEGFGNALVEALACGTQVVSTNCPHGPAEILENGRFGRLVAVGDTLAMAENIIHAISDPLPVEKLTLRGRAFTVARAAGLYEELFNHIIE